MQQIKFLLSKDTHLTFYGPTLSWQRHNIDFSSIRNCTRL